MAYPDNEARMEELVREHARLKDEPLLLAVYFASQSAPADECLFEVAENFGFNDVSGDRQVMQIAFGPTVSFPLNSGQHLRLWLTNPTECLAALAEQWPDVVEVQRALATGQAKVIYSDQVRPEAQRLLDAMYDQRVAA